MTIISDSGPIISFARANCLELLRRTLQEIKIPQAVYNDIVLQGSLRPGAEDIKNANWIKKERIKKASEVNQFPPSLGLGEREAIVLAKGLNAFLLIDDRSARKEAEKNGIMCFGTLKVLKMAKETGFLEKIKPVGDKLRDAGLRVKDSLYQKFLQEVGE